MRTIEKTIYTFDELSDSAKERAREWMRVGLEYPWFSEALDSLRSFCDEFGVEVLDYSIGDHRYFVRTDVTSNSFRGLKLSQFNREAMPTGMCFDCDLRYTFADEWKRTADPRFAFGAALDALCEAVIRDVDHYFSDKSIDESIEANGHEFDENGGAA